MEEEEGDLIWWILCALFTQGRDGTTLWESDSWGPTSQLGGLKEFAADVLASKGQSYIHNIRELILMLCR